MEKPKTILIVEDSKLLREVLRDSLESAGFVTLEAENGKVGLEAAMRSPPDLIILDLLMPVMDGMAMYQKLRADVWGAKVPVIMLTATKSEKITSWLNSEHLDFFLKDNWMIEEVVGRVKQRLGME